MKKILFIVCMTASVCFSQTKIDRIAVPTPKLDTLYVPNDVTGKNIILLWENFPDKRYKTPVILTVTMEQLIEKFVKYKDQIEEAAVLSSKPNGKN